jgi:hypothetical protein
MECTDLVNRYKRSSPAVVDLRSCDFRSQIVRPANRHGSTWRKIRGSERVPNVTSFAFIQAQVPEEAFASTWGRGLWTLSLDFEAEARPRPPPPRPPPNPGAAGPRPVGEQSSLVPGDAAEARKRLSEITPRLIVGTPGRRLPPKVVLALNEIELSGSGWAPTTTAEGALHLTLDGRPIPGVAIRVDRDGKIFGFAAPHPGSWASCACGLSTRRK